jgi:hypothetical protein
MESFIVSYISLRYLDECIHIEYTRVPYDEESMFYQERETFLIKNGHRKVSKEHIHDVIDYVKNTTFYKIDSLKDIESLSIQYVLI